MERQPEMLRAMQSWWPLYSGTTQLLTHLAAGGVLTLCWMRFPALARVWALRLQAEASPKPPLQREVTREIRELTSAGLSADEAFRVISHRQGDSDALSWIRP